MFGLNDNALTPYQKYVVNWDAFNPSHLSSTQNTITREYDALNRIRKAKYPQDRAGQRKEMTPKYNKGGALLSLKVGGTDFVKEIAYNARGQRIMLAMGNGVMTRYAYDPQTFRMVRTRSEKFTKSDHTYTPNGGVQQDLAYTYDLEGSILTQKDQAPANASAQGPGDLLRVFTHDPLRRLLSATGRESSNVYEQPSWDLNIRPHDHTATNTYTRSYAYDKLGNIQMLKHVADGKANQDFVRHYEYGTGDNRLKTFVASGTAYENLYDANGNLTKEGENRYYEWNANDKLAVFKNQAGASTPTVYSNYFYNAQGERVKKHTRKGNKITVTFYMDGGIFETSYVKPTGGSIDNNRFYNTLHVLDPSTGLGQVKTGRIATVRIGSDADDPTPQVKYCLEDHLMDSLVVLDIHGNLVNREQFYPFGETSFGGFAKKRYRFNGKEKDEESGLYEYGQRYYAPWLCRFVSVDPIAEDYPQLSSYNYAGNKPISYKDLEGLQSPAEDVHTDNAESKNVENGEKAQNNETNNIEIPEYYSNDQGFFLEGDNDFGEYSGNVKPTDDRYYELEKIDGKLYHKNTTNVLATVVNKIAGLLGSEENNMVEKKPYDHAEKASNPFDYRSIADVLVTIEYDALYDDLYGRTIRLQLNNEGRNDSLVFSLVNDLPDQWYELTNAAGSPEGIVTHFDVHERDLAPNVNGNRLIGVKAYLSFDTDKMAENGVGLYDNIPGELMLAKDDPGEEAGSVIPLLNFLMENLQTFESFGGIESPIEGRYYLRLTDTTSVADMLANGYLRDILLVFSYSTDSIPFVIENQ